MTDTFHAWRRNSPNPRLDGYVFGTRNHKPRDYPYVAGDYAGQWETYTHLGSDQDWEVVRGMIQAARA